MMHKLVNRPIAHPDWIEGHWARLQHYMALREAGRMPVSIDAAMMVTPIRGLLRSIYGSDLKAAWSLLAYALWIRIEDIPWAFVRFWNFKILLKSPHAEAQKWLAEEEAKDQEENEEEAE